MLPRAQGDPKPHLRTICRSRNPQKVMVFVAVASDGYVMDPIFIPSSKSYKRIVLQPLITWMESVRALGQALLQQNGAPTHTANSTQSYLLSELGENGWPKKMWPPSSPDCSPLDLAVWSNIQAKTN